MAGPFDHAWALLKMPIDPMGRSDLENPEDALHEQGAFDGYMVPISHDYALRTGQDPNDPYQEMDHDEFMRHVNRFNSDLADRLHWGRQLRRE